MSNVLQSAVESAAGDAVCAGHESRSRMKDYMLFISVVARMFNVSTFELWIYELLGLIRRERVGNVWAYPWSHCGRVALIVRGREAGLRLRDLRPVVIAMNENASPSDLNKGKAQALSLIRALECGTEVKDKALDELYLVDWELSERLGVVSAYATDPRKSEF